MHANTLQIGFFLLAFSAIVVAKPLYKFVGSFSEPCSESFYSSSTLFEATRGCILRGK
jgi:hypothetical protein